MNVFKKYVMKEGLKNPMPFNSDNEYVWYIQTYWWDKKSEI